MKKGTLVAIIAVVAFLSAVVGAIFVLKKRGILFCDDCCCDLDFDECSCDDEEASENVEDKRSRRVGRRAATFEEEKQESQED